MKLVYWRIMGEVLQYRNTDNKVARPGTPPYKWIL